MMRMAQRIYNLIDDLKRDPEKTYLLGAADYILEMDGDGNTAFRGAEILMSGGMTDCNILADWVAQHSTVADEYRETEGRITVK